MTWLLVIWFITASGEYIIWHYYDERDCMWKRQAQRAMYQDQDHIVVECIPQVLISYTSPTHGKYKSY